MYLITNEESQIISMSPPKYIKHAEEDNPSSGYIGCGEAEAEGIVVDGMPPNSRIYSIEGKPPFKISDVYTIETEDGEVEEKVNEYDAPYASFIVVPDGEYVFRNHKSIEKGSGDIEELQNFAVDTIISGEENQTLVETALVELAIDLDARITEVERKLNGLLPPEEEIPEEEMPDDEENLEDSEETEEGLENTEEETEEEISEEESEEE